MTELSDHARSVGMVLVTVGVVIIIIVFYFALSAYMSLGSEPHFKLVFGGAMGYLQQEGFFTNSTLGALGGYAGLIIVILIMAVFLSIALAAGSIILGRGVELLRGCK